MWDPLVRLVHWSVALLVVIDLLNEAGANPWHRGLGYAAAALVLVRLAWGLADSGTASLAAMARSARQALPYARSLLAGRSSLPPGHNPLGVLMAWTLWSLVLLAALTGWLLQLERFWGEDWLQEVHSAGAYALAAFAVLHVAGVLAMSALHRVNLAKAMITGRRATDQKR